MSEHQHLEMVELLRASVGTMTVIRVPVKDMHNVRAGATVALSFFSTLRMSASRKLVCTMQPGSYKLVALKVPFLFHIFFSQDYFCEVHNICFQ